MGKKWETEKNSYREKENQGHKKGQTMGVTHDGETGQEGLSLRVTIPFHTTQTRQDLAWGHTEVRDSARGLK